MDKKKQILTVLLLLLAVLSASAQLAVMPMETNGRHIFIELTSGSGAPMRFVFDTGATNASIDSAVAVKAGLDMSSSQVVSSAGHNSTQNYRMLIGQDFKVVGLELKGINPLVDNFSAMSASTGMKLDGIIGYEILDRYVTALDFGKKKMSFYGSIKDVDTTGYTGIPFEFNKGVLIPRFPVTIKLLSGERFTGRVMFDSGGFFSLLVSTPFNKFHGLSEKIPDKTIKHSRGVSAVTNEERGVIAGMSFNGFELGKMAIDLTINDKAEAKDGYLGMIGTEIIDRFDLIFDYANKKIYMKPNAAYASSFDIGTVVGQKDLTLESKTFLESNKMKPGIKVTPSGLQYKVIRTGEGPMPLASDKVKIHYSMARTDGTAIWKPFDIDHPWIHHIDKALPGIQEALLMMPVGSKWTIYMPAELAFGPDGHEEIAKGTAVVALVELVAIVKE
ncbi:aspartyl protease family protein [Pedobacter sp. UC225_61]|uniref:aspartyl protease family protein n=1 Tax=Pedobacter sp. UC225_61 TaxID=3374623 RepID=UPI00378F6F2C